MKLSEAILLGDVLKKGDPWTWLSADGSCGCALGGALLACGVNVSEFYREQQLGAHKSIADSMAVSERWPWLTENDVIEISSLYFRVDDGDNTIEDVAAYVRTIEPAEEATPQTEPDALLVAASVAQ